MSSTTPPHPTQDRPTTEAGNDSPTISRAPAWSDTDSDPGAPPFVRDQEFWLDDGTIILIARGIGFRVYRGLLAAQSPIFRDTLSCASPSKSAGESFDGCPVVHLTDSPEDLRHLLRVILPVTKRTFDCGAHLRKGADTTFDQLSSVIRLAHKYGISDVEEQGLDVLKAWYPSDFNAFQKLKTIPCEWDREFYARAIGAVNLARLSDTPEILPLALYACFHIQGAVLDGWRRQDGMVEHLDSADLRRCLNARVPLSKQSIDMRINLLRKGLEIICSEEDKPCSDIALNLFLGVTSITGGGPDGVFGSWKPHILSRFSDSACTTCMETMLRLDREEQERIWNMLPEIFDVQGNGLGGSEKADEARAYRP